jgi:Ala-tRNA(Pro) deacylase
MTGPPGLGRTGQVRRRLRGLGRLPRLRAILGALGQLIVGRARLEDLGHAERERGRFDAPRPVRAARIGDGLRELGVAQALNVVGQQLHARAPALAIALTCSNDEGVAERRQLFQVLGESAAWIAALDVTARASKPIGVVLALRSAGQAHSRRHRVEENPRASEAFLRVGTSPTLTVAVAANDRDPFISARSHDHPLVRGDGRRRCGRPRGSGPRAQRRVRAWPADARGYLRRERPAAIAHRVEESELAIAPSARSSCLLEAASSGSVKSGPFPVARVAAEGEAIGMSSTDPGPATERGFALTRRFLEEHDVPHRVIEHPPTYTAEADARASHLPLEQTAKSVVVNCGEIDALAVIPAARRLDLHKLAVAIGGTPTALADEAEMARAFPDYEVGAEPPIGPLVNAPVVIDKSLLGHDEVVCAGGDHRHSLLLDPLQLARVSDATVAEICAT